MRDDERRAPRRRRRQRSLHRTLRRACGGGTRTHARAHAHTHTPDTPDTPRGVYRLQRKARLRSYSKVAENLVEDARLLFARWALCGDVSGQGAHRRGPRSPRREGAKSGRPPPPARWRCAASGHRLAARPAPRPEWQARAQRGPTVRTAWALGFVRKTALSAVYSHQLHRQRSSQAEAKPKVGGGVCTQVV